MVLAGLDDEPSVRRYQQKITELDRRFREKCARHQPVSEGALPEYRHRSVARCLFEFLWSGKPQRFGQGFQLTEVIDAQLDPDPRRPVGNCVGLTALYTVLGMRAGLRLSILNSASHVRSRLRVGDQGIDIEHTDPAGFDWPPDPAFGEWPSALLAANVLNCRGLQREREHRFLDAAADYQLALRIHPGYANAFNNRGNMRLRRGDLKGAIADYSEAIRLAPRFHEAYCNRGLAWRRCGRPDLARADSFRALAIEPGYRDAQILLDLCAIEPGD